MQVGLLIFVLIALGVMFVQGIIGLQTGVVSGRGGPYRRDTDPTGFWIAVLTYLIGPPVLLVIMFMPRH